MRQYLYVLFIAISTFAFTLSAHGQIAALDPSFAQQGTGLSAQVNAVAVQNDGKIIVAGSFSDYNGIGRKGIARLNADGSLDPTFNPGLGFNAAVNSIALQTDGMIVVGGAFTTFNGNAAPYITRLNADGSEDVTFNQLLGGALNSAVNVVKVLPNGQVLVGGSFTGLGLGLISQLIRLNSNGSQDLTLLVGGLSTLGSVKDLAVQPDGKIIIVGEFTSVGLNPAKRVARLTSLGLFDTTFIIGSGFNATVHAIALQSDGKVVVGGAFTDYNGTAVGRIARINTSGAVDPTFAAEAEFDNEVYELKLQSDGKILVGGRFATGPGAVYRSYMARLNVEGTLDLAFETSASFNLPVRAIALLSDERIVVGGEFTLVSDSPTPYVVVLLNHSIAIQSTSPTAPWCAGTTIQIIFSVSGSFNSGNTFTAQLSDASGSFATPTDIGFSPSPLGGQIYATIPINTPSGTNYALRIVSSSPLAESFDALEEFYGLEINASTEPLISVTADQTGAICEGELVTFTATAVNGGATPFYTWYRNGTAVGGNSPTYSDNILQDGDEIWCELSSSENCASPMFVQSDTLVMNVLPLTVPSASITVFPNGAVCEGTNLIFSASPVDAGSTPTYQWTLNGSNVGTNAANYVNATLVNGDVVMCTITSSALCPSPLSANSNPIVANIITPVMPSVSITSDLTTICDGAVVTFNALPVNGGGSPDITWTVNDVDAGIVGSTFITSSLADGDVVASVLTNNDACVSPASVVSNPIAITVLPNLTPTVTISANPIGQVCEGTTVQFTAVAVDAGAGVVYAWDVDGQSVGSNASTFSSSTLVDGDGITCTIQSSVTCVTTSTAISNTILASIESIVVPSISIASDQGASVCAGSTVTFTATPSLEGSAPTYAWTVNGVDAGETSTSFTTNTLVDGDVVVSSVINTDACASTTAELSSVIAMTVIPNVTPSISITSDQGTSVCAGSTVTFTATPSLEGSAPVYAWTVNGIDAGETSTSFTTSSLGDGDVVVSSVINTDACASATAELSNAITMTVIPNITPTVSISASVTGLVCSGTSVTFTASATDAGANPSYQWFKNGIPVGVNAANYTSAALLDDDQVLCTVTSATACVGTSTVTSAPVVMDIAPTVTPSVFVLTDIGTTVCAGVDVTFTALVANPGAAPTYAWQVNGVDIGVSTSTYTTNSLADGASVKCFLTNTDACATPATVNSDAAVITVVSPPAAPQAILGNTTICAEDTESFSVPTVADAFSYTWTLPSGWSGNSTTNGIAATSGTTGGVISVTANGACGNSVATTLSVTVNPSFSDYSGTVTVNGANVNAGWVYALKQQITGVGWEKADSTQIVNGTYHFTQLPIYGVPFILKAVAPCQNCVPTYYAAEMMSHQWDSSGLSYSLFSDCGGIHQKNIAMVTTQGVLDGICTISGTVYWATNKQAAEDPIPLIDVVVEKVPPGNAFTYGQTDADGNGTYSFDNMPVLQGDFERYRIYISMPGIPMDDTYYIDINPNDTYISNLDFYVDTVANTISILNPNGVHESLVEVEGLRLLPNPMHDRMTVVLPSKFGSASSYRIIAVDGKVVAERDVRGLSTISVERQSLPSGVYFLEVVNTQGVRKAAKLLVQ